MKKRTFFPLRNKSDDPEIRRKTLLNHLYTALRIEHATIPPYLFALFSIKDPDRVNFIPAKIIRSVAMEEMLHMVLVANIINAIQNQSVGQELCQYLNIDRPEFGINYPAKLPGIDSDFSVDLSPFSLEALDTFLAIEKPMEMEKEDAPTSKGYKSIGQFYAILKQELFDFCEDFGEEKLFAGDPDRQLGPEYYYNGGGEIIKVGDLESAHRAIKVIVDEGEGYLQSIFSSDHEEFGEIKDLAHYFKFKQLKAGKFYTNKDKPESEPSGETVPLSFATDQIYPASAMLKLQDTPEIAKKTQECNMLYWNLIRACQDAFNGQGNRLNEAIIYMHTFRESSKFLMRLEVGATGFNAAPTFEYQPAMHDHT